MNKILSELNSIIDSLRKGGGKELLYDSSLDVQTIRRKTNLGQSAFAAVLGISTRTLQDWEQHRRKPSGPAQSLLIIARERPDILREVFGNLLTTREKKTR
jgi:putative transcriptional regulator